mgnify:CR=1 FL=1
MYDLELDFDELNNLAERKKIPELKSHLKKIKDSLTPSEKIDAAQKVDRKTRERMASLGYISNVQVTKKKHFGIHDDVKTLLPYINKTEEARELFKGGKGDEGIKLLRKIIEERNNMDLAYISLARIYHAKGNTEEAIAILEQGLGVLPSNYLIFIQYMELLTSAKKYDKVITSFEKMSIREAEYDPAIWNSLGVAYAKKGNFEEAIEALKMGLSLDDDLPGLNNNLADVYCSYGQQLNDSVVFSQCFEYFKKAIELDSQYAAPYRGLGRAYRQVGNLEGAIYCWGKALEMIPDSSQVVIDLAQVYLDTGDKAKAFDVLSDYKKQYYHLIPSVEREKIKALLEKARK